MNHQLSYVIISDLKILILEKHQDFITFIKYNSLYLFIPQFFIKYKSSFVEKYNKCSERLSKIRKLGALFSRIFLIIASSANIARIDD